MREARLPSFCTKMDFKSKVKNLLEEGLKKNPSLFLIDLSISDSYKITVVLDGDNGVSLQDCMDISRAIEHNLDREEQDFSLEVASAGVSAPLKMSRQYKKNIGRNIKLTTSNNEIIEAKLVDADDEKAILNWKERVPKKVGKGKETVEFTKEFLYTDIKEAIITIKF
jgi:ribosome maturation factor RimP